MLWNNKSGLDRDLCSKVLKHSHVLYYSVTEHISGLQTYLYFFSISICKYIPLKNTHFLCFLPAVQSQLCLCLFKISMSSLRHAFPSTDPYLVKSLLILPIPFGACLFSAFIFPVWKGLLFLKLPSGCKRPYTLSILNISMTFPWAFSGYTSFLSWAKQTIASVPEGAGPRVWTGPRLLSMLFFNFLAQYFMGFLMTTNTLFFHPQIMTTLDPIFSSLQRGSRQVARLCHDQPKQLISWRQEPNYSICKITTRSFDLLLTAMTTRLHIWN